jgi:hypothetical protein
MILLTAGQSTTLTAGIKGQIYFLTINGGSSATVSGAVTDFIGPSQNTKSYGPFDIGQSIVVACAQGEVRIETGDSNPVTNDGAATLSDVGAAIASPSLDYSYPDDTFDVTASQIVSAGPCKIASVQCVAGSAIALTVYDNRAASGAILFTGTLSAGDMIEFPSPLVAINSAFASFTGTATFRFKLRSI